MAQRVIMSQWVVTSAGRRFFQPRCDLNKLDNGRSTKVAGIMPPVGLLSTRHSYARLIAQRSTTPDWPRKATFRTLCLYSRPALVCKKTINLKLRTSDSKELSET